MKLKKIKIIHLTFTKTPHEEKQPPKAHQSKRIYKKSAAVLCSITNTMVIGHLQDKRVFENKNVFVRYFVNNQIYGFNASRDLMSYSSNLK